jgi:hypothetical protein
MFDFMVCKWSAWSPEINDGDDRLIGANNITVPARVPKLLQRRLTPLAKAVFAVADRCINTDEALPVVFSSAHGELSKSLEMLKAIQAGEELSPTAFSLSVHNAIAGLFSIAYDNHQEITVIASGQEGIAPAFIDALGILHESAAAVLVILYDEPVTDFYPISPFNLSASPCVLALRIALSGEGLPLSLNRATEFHDTGEHSVQLLTFLKFLLTDNTQALSLGNWIWCKK